MLRIMYIFLLLPCFTWAGEITKDDLKKAFNEIRTAYINEKSYSMNISHKSFVDQSDVTPFESSNGSFIKDGNKYKSDIMGVTSIQNGEFKLAISDKYKIIVLSQKDDYLNIALDNDEMDIMLSKSIKIESSKIGSSVIYKVFMNDSHELEYYSIKVNDKKFISEMSMYYREEKSWTNEDGTMLKGKPKLTISYTNIKTKVKTDKNSFSFEEIISETPNGYQPIGKYVSYTLNDNRIKIK
jgi:hypothetical protein